MNPSAIILHADVVGSTALVQLDETLAHQRIQDTFRRFSEIIISHSGIAHEIRGDALVPEFARVSDAIGASLAFQAANSAHNEELSDEVRPFVRVGIAMGEVVVADNTLTGEGSCWRSDWSNWLSQEAFVSRVQLTRRCQSAYRSSTRIWVSAR